MTQWHGVRLTGHRRNRTARPSTARTAADSWIDSRCHIFLIRCQAIDAGLRWLPEIPARMAPQAPGVPRTSDPGH